MCDRRDEDYHAMDLLSDILSRGNSARLYNRLVKEECLFSDLSCFVMGDMDKGLFVVTGKVSPGVSIEKAEAAIFLELEKVHATELPERELQKVKNKTEASLFFAEMSILDKSLNLAYFELLGDIELINKEISNYLKVTTATIQQLSKEVLRKTNCSSLHYRSNRKNKN